MQNLFVLNYKYNMSIEILSDVSSKCVHVDVVKFILPNFINNLPYYLSPYSH